jgi:translation initiation factor IF-1
VGSPTKRILSGEIVEVEPNLPCQVRLVSGEQVPTRIPHHIARLMFRVVPGDRVAVEQRGAGSFVVHGHEQAVIDAQCAAYLSRDGRSVADWSLVGELICFRDRRHGDTGELLSSDDRWYAQLRDYSRRVGAHEYGSHDEISRHAEPFAAPDRPAIMFLGLSSSPSGPGR